MLITDSAKQYKTSTNLKARGNLHARYATKNWFDWVARQISMPEDGDVLDVGCGAGWFWGAAAKHYPDSLKITLVDQSEGMVTEAVQNLTNNDRYSDVSGKVADATNVPFEAECFDRALLMHMLYHVPTPADAIAEVARVLRAGGMIAITTNGDDNLRELFELGAEVFGGVAGDPAAQAFSASTAQDLLSVGFEDVTVHVFEDEYAVKDPEDIFDYLTSFPPGSQASEVQLDALRSLISARLADGDGVLKVKREGSLITAVVKG